MAEHETVTKADVDNKIATHAGLLNVHEIPRTATVVVAADDSTAKSKAQADFVLGATPTAAEITALFPTTGKIVFLEGTYSIDNALGAVIVPDNITMKLLGTFVAGTKTLTLVQIDGDNVVLRGGVYDGNRGVDSADSGVYVILVNGASGDLINNTVLENLTVQNGYSRGIMVAFAYGAYLKNVYVNNCWRNIMVWVDIDTIDGLALECFAVLDGVVSENAITEGIDGSYPNWVISNVRVKDNAIGIVVDSWLNLILSNIEAAGQGINLVTGAWGNAYAKNAVLLNIVADNIHMTHQAAVESIYASNVVLVDGPFWLTMSSASDIEYIGLANVEARASTAAGFIVDGAGAGAINVLRVINCTFRDNDGDGAKFTHTLNDVSFTQCTFRGNQDNGFSNFGGGAIGMLRFIGCDFIVTDAYAQIRGLWVENTTDLIMIGNNIETHVNPSSLTATNKIIRNNKGWVTENSGTGTILNTTTAIVITHGLSVTPTVDDISITLAENPTNDPGNIWVDTITATQFTVNCRADPGASNLDFGWRVVVL